MCVPRCPWQSRPETTSRQDGDRDPQARGEIGDRQAGLHRRAAALAGEAHDAAHGLEDGVVALAVRVGAALAEAGAGHVDDALVDRADRRIVEAVALERADREVLQEHVGLPARSRTIAWPSGERRLTVTDCLPRLQAK